MQTSQHNAAPDSKPDRSHILDSNYSNGAPVTAGSIPVPSAMGSASPGLPQDPQTTLTTPATAGPTDTQQFAMDMPRMPASVASMYETAGEVVDATRMNSLYKSLVLFDPVYVAQKFSHAVVSVDKAAWANPIPDTIDELLAGSLKTAPAQFWQSFSNPRIERRPLIARVRNWMAHMIKSKHKSRVLPAVKVLDRLQMTEDEFASSKLVPVLRILTKGTDNLSKAADELGKKFKAYTKAEPARDEPSTSANGSHGSNGSNGAHISVVAPQRITSPVGTSTLGAIPKRIKKVEEVKHVEPIKVPESTPSASTQAQIPAPSVESSISKIPATSSLPSFTKPKRTTEEKRAPAKLQVDVERARSASEKAEPKATPRVFSSIGDLKAQIGKRPRPAQEPEPIPEVAPKKSKKNKTVRWKPDDELVQVRYFETQSDNLSLRSSRGAKDVDLAEGAVARDNKTMIDWRQPSEIPSTPWLDERLFALMGIKRGGSKAPISPEANIQLAREAKVLMVLYDDSNIPPNPTEPVYEHVPETQPLSLPRIQAVPPPPETRAAPPPVAVHMPVQQAPVMQPMFTNMMMNMPMSTTYMMNMGQMGMGSQAKLNDMNQFTKK